MMNVHWLAPTQTPRNPAFLQYNLEPQHSCCVHSLAWGALQLVLGSHWPHAKLWSPAHICALKQTRDRATALSHGEQPTTQNGISNVPGGAFWEVCHTESWEEQDPARDQAYVPEVRYKFGCTYPSDQVTPFSRRAEWQNKLSQKHFMRLFFITTTTTWKCAQAQWTLLPPNSQASPAICQLPPQL